jgi:hypothetical protein
MFSYSLTLVEIEVFVVYAVGFIHVVLLVFGMPAVPLAVVVSIAPIVLVVCKGLEGLIERHI